ncbi:MAG: DNA/RNA nuclease SfsA [Thermotogae bacterium]|nr:DNA/RNA nuclease SfsA [Thermotogota bacterium]
MIGSRRNSAYTSLLKVETVGCRFLERINRFVSRVVINGLTHEVHTNNTGRLEDLLVPGTDALCIPISGRKLRYRMVGTSVSGSALYTLIDTSLQEKAVARAISAGAIKGLEGVKVVGRHVKVGNSRFDLLLRMPDGGERLAEIKSAVFYFPEDGSARYPDTITERGRRHIELLGALEGVLIFVAAHPLARAFKPCHRDPEIPRLIGDFGGTVLAVKMAITARGEIILLGDIPVER